MGETEAVEVEAGGRSLRLVPRERAPGSSAGYFDVELRTQEMLARFPLSVSLSDLRLLHGMLLELHSRFGQGGNARFTLDDGALDIMLHLSPSGELMVEVRARLSPDDGPVIRFAMRADQSYLPVWWHSVAGVIRTFPLS